MKGFQRLALAGAMALMTSTQASAAVISLFDYAFNINGTVTSQAAPGGVNVGGFDTSTGLGTINVTVSGAGNKYVALFVDHEIDEATNTFFNENGSTSGTPDADQSWEIDEPEYVFGDIWTNFNAGSLDGSNPVPAGSEDDVSMAMGWDFTLASGQTALINFLISETAPTGGYYLTHTDPESQAAIYLSSRLDIRGGQSNIPEPATLALVGVGLLGLWQMQRRRLAA